MKITSLGQFFRRSYFLPLVLAVAAALIAVNELGYRQSSEAALRTIQAQHKRAALDLLLQQMLDAEAGQRAYLLSAHTKYLEPYRTASDSIAASLDTLRTLYVSDQSGHETVALLSRALSRRLGEMDVTMKLRPSSEEAQSGLAVVEAGVSTEQMNVVRTRARELIETATAEMNSSMVKIQNSLQVSRIGISMAALLSVLAFRLFLRQTEALRVSAEREKQSMATEAKRLDLLVQERTDTLAELATHLQIVQEQERERLARELHDELGALLTAAKLDLARAKSSLTTGNEKALDRLARLNTTINDVVTLKRRIIEDLRPSSLSNLGLVSALEVLAREYRERSGLTVTLNLEEVELPEDAELTIFRLVQESFTNIAKYANASEVTLTLHNYVGHVEVAVADNGQGFEVASKFQSSHGLTGMRHRIHALRGRLTVKSKPGDGTQIEAYIPKIGGVAA